MGALQEFSITSLRHGASNKDGNYGRSVLDVRDVSR
jgi:hypothetical protein